MEFFDKVKAFLDMPEKQRNYEEGARMMLQISMNRIQYNNVMRNLARHHDTVEWVLSKYIKEHLTEETSKVVKGMRKEAEQIAAKRHLDLPNNDKPKGKRNDHEALPEEIKALYVENLALLRSMRELNTQLRIIARDPKVTCLDSEQFPFLKDLIDKDKQYHENWQKYDSWTAEGEAEAIAKQDAMNANIKALRAVNLLKGKYRKNPSPELKKRIVDAVKNVPNPPEKLISELTFLGIYEKD